LTVKALFFIVTKKQNNINIVRLLVGLRLPTQHQNNIKAVRLLVGLRLPNCALTF
jgi:hypothetical protein